MTITPPPTPPPLSSLDKTARRLSGFGRDEDPVEGRALGQAEGPGDRLGELDRLDPQPITGDDRAVEELPMPFDPDDAAAPTDEHAEERGRPPRA